MTEWIITSSALTVIMIALRYALKGKISLRLQYGLWALVLIRLLLPFSIVDSAVSVSNVLSAPVIRQADEAVTDYKDSYQSVLTDYAQRGEETDLDTLREQAKQELLNRTQQKLESQYAQAGAALDKSEVQLEIQTEAQQQVEVISLAAMVTDTLPYLWLGGMILSAAVLAGSNLHFWWKLRKSRKAVDMPGVPLKVYLTDYVATPCLFGIGQPAIYLTEEVVADPQMRSHVLAHEMSHYRQGDHIWSLLRCVCLVLHWYNPLVWAAAVLSKQDAELACDEATIKMLGEDQRMAYGRTLVGMTCVRRDPGSMMLTATTMQGTKETLKERISLIARKPKTALYTLIACVLVAAIAVGCTFTGAPTEPQETEPATEPTTESTAEPTNELTEQVAGLRAAAAACDKVDVSFYSMGQVTKWQLDESKLSVWQEWVDNLSLTLLSEDKVAELQMTEGGESYFFKINGGEASFTFMDYGLDHYLVIEGTYYEVLNGVIPDFMPADPTDGYEWEPAAHVSLSADEYFAQTKPVENIDTWLNWTAADGVSRYQVSYTSGYGISVDRLEEPWSEVWKVPNSEQYGDVALMLCDGVYAYGVRQRTELVRIDLKTGSCETIFTADQMMCGFTGDGSCKNIFIIDRDWLYFLAKNDGAIHIYRMYLPELSVEVIGGNIPENTLPTFLNLRYNEDNRTEISCVYLNPDMQTVLLNEINDPNSSYRDVTVQTAEETLSLNWVWENKEALRLESTYYWYGPFEALATRLQNDNSIAFGRAIYCDQSSGTVTTDEVWRLMLDKEYFENATVYYTDTEKFQYLLSQQNGYWYWRILGCTFYEPEEISLEHLFYVGMEPGSREDPSQYTDAEVFFLKNVLKDTFWGEDGWGNAFKLPADEVNAVLETYLGISLEDAVIPDNWYYFEETNAYYCVKTDAYMPGFQITDVRYGENGIVYIDYTSKEHYNTLTGEHSRDCKMVAVLHEKADGSYTILMNVPEAEPSMKEYFTNLLTYENGFWYWRAMGCIFESAEDIDMALLCHIGMENGVLSSSFTDDEIEFLKSSFPATDYLDDSPWSNAHKLPRQELEAVMQTYFGVSLDDVTIPWVYYEETDAYYFVAYDAYGLVDYTVTDVQTDSEGIIYVYWTTSQLLDTRYQETDSLENPQMVLVLEEKADGGYLVLMNVNMADYMEQQERFEEELEHAKERLKELIEQAEQSN